MLTFIANGLGSNVGFVAGWAYVMCLLADVAGIYLLLAGFVANQLNASWHWNTTAVWVVVTIALAAFVTFNGLRQAKRGTRVGAILGTIEVLVFAILAIWLIFAAGGRNTLQVFTTHFANAPPPSSPSSPTRASRARSCSARRPSTRGSR
jgi:amino acid transporter